MDFQQLLLLWTCSLLPGERQAEERMSVGAGLLISCSTFLLENTCCHGDTLMRVQRVWFQLNLVQFEAAVFHSPH